MLPLEKEASEGIVMFHLVNFHKKGRVWSPQDGRT